MENMNISLTLRMLRKIHNVDLKVLSKKLDKHRYTYEEYEKRRTPDLETVCKVCRVYQITPGEFFTLASELKEDRPSDNLRMLADFFEDRDSELMDQVRIPDEKEEAEDDDE